jgi:beta-N-acetylhexosaminidase
MVMALGSLDEQRAALAAIAGAAASGALPAARLSSACTRLDALAQRYPVRPEDYPATQRALDDRLMRGAWAAGLTTLGDARAPRPDQPLRVYTQRSVPCDGVSEAGLPGEQVASLFDGFADVELVQLGALDTLDWSAVPRDGRITIVASNHRARYGARARAWRPDLHLVLWNPFQALDVAAPALVSWGYADGALDALRAWLHGRAGAPGRTPVPLQLPL